MFFHVKVISLQWSSTLKILNLNPKKLKSMQGFHLVTKANHGIIKIVKRNNRVGDMRQEGCPIRGEGEDEYVPATKVSENKKERHLYARLRGEKKFPDHLYCSVYNDELFTLKCSSSWRPLVLQIQYCADPLASPRFQNLRQVSRSAVMPSWGTPSPWKLKEEQLSWLS